MTLCKTGSYLIQEGECLLSHFAFILRACFTIGELTLTACELPVNENFTKNLSLILELCVISLTTSLPKLGEIIVNALISTSSFPAFQKTLTNTHTHTHTHNLAHNFRGFTDSSPLPPVYPMDSRLSLWSGWSLWCFWPLKYYRSEQDILLITNIPSDYSGRIWGWNERLSFCSFQTSNITFSFWSVYFPILMVKLTEFRAIMKSSKQLHLSLLFTLEIIVSQNNISKIQGKRFGGVILCWLQLRVKLMSVLWFISQLNLTYYSVLREVWYPTSHVSSEISSRKTLI